MKKPPVSKNDNNQKNNDDKKKKINHESQNSSGALTDDRPPEAVSLRGAAQRVDAVNDLCECMQISKFPLGISFFFLVLFVLLIVLLLPLFSHTPLSCSICFPAHQSFLLVTLLCCVLLFFLFVCFGLAV